MTGRRLTRIALAAAAALLVAAPARAQESGTGAWAGSELRINGDPNTGSVPFTAYFDRATVPRVIEISVTPSGGPGGSCGLPAPEVGAGQTPTSLDRTFVFECNGTYSISATARTVDSFPDDSTTLSLGFSISMEAPGVAGVNASGAGRSITVIWNDMRFAAKDLSGYVVERRIGTADWTQIAKPTPDGACGPSPSPTGCSYVDEDLPADAGEATYRVSSVRPSPAGDKVSAASATGPTPFEAGPAQPGDGDGTTSPGDGTTDPTTPGGGPGPGPAGPGGDPGGPAGPGSPGPTGGGPGGRPAGSAVRAPRLGITGTFLPPLLRPSDAIQPPSTTEEDGGFSEQLPYDDVEPGEDEPVLPDDELASVFSDDTAGRGMAIPAATALVLAVWAFHLRFLARAAAQPGAHAVR